MIGHLFHRCLDILGCEVAEHAAAHLRTLLLKRLPHIIVAVCAGEHREIYAWILDSLAGPYSGVRTGNGIRGLPCYAAAVGIYLSETVDVCLAGIFDGDLLAIDDKLRSVDSLAQEDCTRNVEFSFCLHHDRTVAGSEEFSLVDIDVSTDLITEAHLRNSLSYTAEVNSISRRDLTVVDILSHGCKQLFESLRVGSEVGIGGMLHKIDIIARLLEFGGDNLACIHGSHTECDECGRNGNLIEGSAHGVLTTD